MHFTTRENINKEVAQGQLFCAYIVCTFCTEGVSIYIYKGCNYVAHIMTRKGGKLIGNLKLLTICH